MKPFYKYIGIALVYKNTEDIVEFVDSFNKKIPSSSKVIIVNSYFDDQTKERVEQLAKETNCDFINVENRGYSYGNNKGIEFARERYSFDFLIISNPDIIIKEFDDSTFEKNVPIIYAPDITTRSGKKQNPNWVHYHKLLDYLQYVACKRDILALEFIVIAMLKFERIIFINNPLVSKKNTKIYSAHGSFIIISKLAIERLVPIFNDNMFLFHEEIYLAYRARKGKILTVFTPFVKIYHKEDGSMRISNVNIAKRSHESEVIYFEQRDESTVR